MSVESEAAEGLSTEQQVTRKALEATGVAQCFLPECIPKRMGKQIVDNSRR